MRFFRAVWAQVVLALGVGFLLTLWAGDVPERAFAGHLGMALMIAGIITGFYQLHEVSTLFKAIARSTLVDNDYLHMLENEALRKLRSNAARTLLARGASNPAYHRLDLENLVDRVLYTDLLPSKGTTRGLYREDYDESVTMEFVPMADAVRHLGLGAPPPGQESYLTKETSIASFTVIAPRSDDDEFREYSHVLSAVMADVPGVPLEKRARAWFGTSQDTMTEAKLRFSDRAQGGFSYDGKFSVPFVEGRARVWIRLEEWRYGMRQPSLFNSMAMPTKGISICISASGPHPPLAFEGDIVAMMEDNAQPLWMPNGITIRYPGWLLEGHGYFVWWWVQTATESRPAA